MVLIELKAGKTQPMALYLRPWICLKLQGGPNSSEFGPKWGIKGLFQGLRYMTGPTELMKLNFYPKYGHMNAVSVPQI